MTATSHSLAGTFLLFINISAIDQVGRRRRNGDYSRV